MIFRDNRYVNGLGIRLLSKLLVLFVFVVSIIRKFLLFCDHFSSNN